MRVSLRGAPADAIADDDSSAFSILADLLIPGRGQPVSKAALVVKDSVIEWVGREDEIPAEYSSLRFSRVPVLMPYVFSFQPQLGAFLVPSTMLTSQPTQ